MEKQIKILLIDLNEGTSRVLASILKEVPGIQVVPLSDELTISLDSIEKENPELVIINLYPTEELALKWARKIAKAFPDLTLFMTSHNSDSNAIIRAMRAGAREFILQPFNRDEIISGIKSFARTVRQSSGLKDSFGKIIAVLGVRGGIGATTFATNLGVNLAKQHNKEAVLLDLNLQMGTAGIVLDLQAKYSILDVANNLEDIDYTLLKSTLPRHASGLCVLPPPAHIEEAESITPLHVEKILNLLKKIFDYIVIDLPKHFDENVIKALDEADQILTISGLDVPTIYNTKRCLELFKRMGYNHDKVQLAMNRYDPHSDLDLPALEKLVAYPIVWRVPVQDLKNMALSENKGIPISILAPNAKISAMFSEIAGQFNGTLYETQSIRNGKSKLLHRLLKRR